MNKEIIKEEYFFVILIILFKFVNIINLNQDNEQY